MVGFWKFNVLVGMLGVLMMVGAGYATQHTFALDPDFKSLAFSASFNLQARDIPSHVFVVGLGMVAYQFLATGVNLLVGFFRAPQLNQNRR